MTNSTTPAAIAPAPTPMPANLTSLARLVLGLLGGYLVHAGKLDPADLNTDVGAGIVVLTALWALWKNSRGAATLAAWMQRPAVTLAIASLPKTPTVPPTAAAALVALAFLPLMDGCAALGSIVTNTPVKPAPATELAAVSTGYGFEVTYNVAAQLYLAQKANLPAATAATIKADLLKVHACTAPGVTPKVCTGYLDVARKAVAASDSATLTAQIALIAQVAQEISKLLGWPLPAPTAAPVAA